MLMDTGKSVYHHVVYDSEVERDFADQLEKNDAIKVYAKLPGWFKVPTPLGAYNPGAMGAPAPMGPMAPMAPMGGMMPPPEASSTVRRGVPWVRATSSSSVLTT